MKLLREFRGRSATFWRELATTAFALASGVGVLAALGGEGWAWWKVAAATCLAGLSIVSVRYAVAEERRRLPLLRASATDLLPRNKEWLSEQGEFLVVTRDMSWEVDDELEALLANKAEAGELTLVVGREGSQSQQLLAAGATVYVYDETKFRPQVRFTILRWGTSDVRVLVHRQNQGLVEFFELSRTDFPAFGLAEDLARFMTASARVRRPRPPAVQ